MEKIKFPYNKYSSSAILALPTNSPKYLQIVIKARQQDAIYRNQFAPSIPSIQ